MAAKKKTASDVPRIDDLVLEARQLYSDGELADGDNRKDMADDLRFTFEPGYQWDATAKSKRIGRPCYSFNRVIGAVNQAIGEQRQVTPSGKVRAVSKDAAAETANVFGGLIRNIESVSRAEDIYDNQFKYAVAGAYGAWRVLPYFCDPGSFDQELRIEEIANPFTVMWIGGTDPCKRDADAAIVAERISRETYKARHPGFRPTSFQTTRDSKGWLTDKDARVAEVYKKKISFKTIALLDDGRVVDYDAKTKRILSELEEFAAGAGKAAPKVERTRRVEVCRVVWYKTDGANLLEGPIEYEWTYIPVIRLPGRYVNIEGKQILQSLIRHSKDPQRTYNYHRSTMVETAAMTPKSPYLVTPKMITGFEDEWKTVNAVNRPYLKYNLDPAAVASGMMPKRESPPDVPQALVMLAQQDAEDIRQTTGYQNPANDTQQTQGNESGVALGRRMAAMESGAYEFLSNLGKAIQFTWDCCIDMIPTVMDTDRIVRILGEDGVEDYVRVNGKGEKGELINMLKQGKYDVTVTLGPSFATARLESMATLLDAAEKVPAIGEAAPDLIAKNLDVRDGSELHKRVRQQMIQQGKIQPNENDLRDMPPPSPPDPVQKGLADRLAAQAAKDTAAAQKTQAETVTAAIKAHAAPLELQAMIDAAVSARLDNLLKAQELGLGPAGAAKVQSSVERDAGVG
jgi:hypothetical protein